MMDKETVKKLVDEVNEELAEEDIPYRLAPEWYMRLVDIDVVKTYLTIARRYLGLER